MGLKSLHHYQLKVKWHKFMQGIYKMKKFTGYVTRRAEKMGYLPKGGFRPLTQENAENQYRKALARESKKTFSFWAKLKYLWLRAKIKTNQQMKRLFTSPTTASNA